MSPYETLGLPRSADDDAIKLAWRSVAKECHPDKVGDDADLLGRFMDCKSAYELLIDPLRRQFYDRHGQDAHELGLRDADTIRQALRARRGGLSATRPKVHRSECPECEGTGWRPNKRACTFCSDSIKKGHGGSPGWDPTRVKEEVGGSVPRRFRLRPKKPKR